MNLELLSELVELKVDKYWVSNNRYHLCIDGLVCSYSKDDIIELLIRKG